MYVWCSFVFTKAFSLHCSIGASFSFRPDKYNTCVKAVSILKEFNINSYILTILIIIKLFTCLKLVLLILIIIMFVTIYENIVLQSRQPSASNRSHKLRVKGFWAGCKWVEDRDLCLSQKWSTGCWNQRQWVSREI